MPHRPPPKWSELLEAIGPEPSLAVLFATGRHIDSMDHVVVAVNAVLRPEHLVGATAASVIGGSTEVEGRDGLALWAARFDAPVAVAHLVAVHGPDGAAIIGLDRAALDASEAMLLLADPLSFPLEEFLAMLREDGVTVPIIGGVASAAFEPAGNRLMHDHDLHRKGAVAVLIAGRGGRRDGSVPGVPTDR